MAVKKLLSAGRTRGRTRHKSVSLLPASRKSLWNWWPEVKRDGKAHLCLGNEMFSWQNLTLVNTWANHYMCGKVYGVHVGKVELLYGQVNSRLFCFWRCLEFGREKEISFLNNCVDKEEEKTFQQEIDDSSVY